MQAINVAEMALGKTAQKLSGGLKVFLKLLLVDHGDVTLVLHLLVKMSTK